MSTTVAIVGFVSAWLAGFIFAQFGYTRTKEKLHMTRNALYYFVARVDEGSIRSVKTCRFFKEVLEKTK